jgi:predicted dehydrogenase
MIDIAVIGCGHWGPNYIRNFLHLNGVGKIFCCDKNPDVLKRIKTDNNSVEALSDYKEAIKNKDIDAVIVATPTSTHFDIAKEAILTNKHVLVEKPLALTYEECKELEELNKKTGKILMVAHTFIYNSAVTKLKEFIDKEILGEIYYLHSTRTHLGLIREDVNAVWDLAPHDVSIMLYFLDAMPISVSAVGGAFLKKTREDVAFVNLKFSSGIVGNIHISWADSNKVRQIEVIGSNARAVFNDLDNLEKLKLYQKGISTEKPYSNFGEFQYLLRDGDIISPKIDLTEPVKILCQHFLDCIENKKKPITDVKSGADVVKVMCAIEESLKNGGMPVNV